MKLKHIVKLSLILGIILLGAQFCFATTLEVGAAKAYVTIQSALNVAVSGDVVVVSAGIFSEVLTVKNSGVTLEAASNQSVEIVGRIDVGSNKNVTIKGLTIRGWDYPNHGIYQNGGSGLTVQNCIIYNTAGYGSSGGIYSRNSSGLVIQENEIYNCIKGIIIISGHSNDGTYEGGIQIIGNKIHDNPNDGVDIHGEYITMDNNLIYDNMDSNYASTHPDGIQLIASTADGFTSVRYCKIKNNIIRNHTQNIFTEGTLTGESSNCRYIYIYGNVVYNESGTVNGVSMDALGTKNIILRNSANVVIYNNTLGRAGNNSIFLLECMNGTISIKNNIIYNALGNGVYVPDPNDIAVNGLDYNLYSGSTYPIIWGSTYYKTIDSFNLAQNSLEINGLDENPLLNSWPNATPLTNSPCIGRGKNLGEEYAYDKNGYPRDSDWEIGAFEYNGQNNISSPVNLRVAAYTVEQ